MKTSVSIRGPATAPRLFPHPVPRPPIGCSSVQNARPLVKETHPPAAIARHCLQEIKPLSVSLSVPLQATPSFLSRHSFSALQLYTLRARHIFNTNAVRHSEPPKFIYLGFEFGSSRTIAARAGLLCDYNIRVYDTDDIFNLGRSRAWKLSYALRHFDDSKRDDTPVT